MVPKNFKKKNLQHIRLRGYRKFESPKTSGRQNEYLVRGNSGRYYELRELLGRGGFGMVHLARVSNSKDSNSEPVVDSQNTDLIDMSKRAFAIKTGKCDPLSIEMSILYKVRGLRHFCELIDCGTLEAQTRISFIVMSLLGPSLSDMRHNSPGKCFSFSTAIRAGIQMLSAIQEIHECGFIQRDIKPSNFAIGLPDEGRHRLIHMIDFGISKWYLDSSKNLLPPKPCPGWRGTIRYCSINNHMRYDLSRRDDIESWFYTVVELLTGELPWYNMDRDRKEDIEREKRNIRTVKRQLFMKKCPPEFDVILTSLDRWGFFSVPDYDGIYIYMTRALNAAGANFSDPYDWELNERILRAKRKEIIKANRKKRKKLPKIYDKHSVFGFRANERLNSGARVIKTACENVITAPLNVEVSENKATSSKSKVRTAVEGKMLENEPRGIIQPLSQPTDETLPLPCTLSTALDITHSYSDEETQNSQSSGNHDKRRATN